ncbi:hypothetical protein K435DRAFT_795732 [Dendrothele bispora CBS 962.96]|uniref:Uncharacterized protein n=1 Tax=Dendrothele bispora (strain CBS 962.96) TaxID=1314807 RepID=A0A4S8M7Y5_DENBC|nr:hypothetical protein K435DRAFT_795732 [Dendrothele bispora CBS 962.96]
MALSRTILARGPTRAYWTIPRMGARFMATAQNPTSSANIREKAEGDISLSFSSLGAELVELPPKFMDLKRELWNENLMNSWREVLSELQTRTEDIISKGTGIIPQINWLYGSESRTFQRAGGTVPIASYLSGSVKQFENYFNLVFTKMESSDDCSVTTPTACVLTTRPHRQLAFLSLAPDSTSHISLGPTLQLEFLPITSESTSYFRTRAHLQLAFLPLASDSISYSY